jgi:hypothetical protein
MVIQGADVRDGERPLIDLRLDFDRVAYFRAAGGPPHPPEWVARPEEITPPTSSDIEWEIPGIRFHVAFGWGDSWIHSLGDDKSPTSYRVYRMSGGYFAEWIAAGYTSEIIDRQPFPTLDN